MVTMDHGGTSQDGQGDEGQATDYLQVARLLREKLSDLVDGDIKGELEPGSGLQSLLDLAASCNIVSVDPKTLNPVLWKSFPMQLLLLVFARLPVPDIVRLHSLSREWRREMTTMNSDIIQACDEARPIMVARFSSKIGIRDDGFFDIEYLITIFDLSTRMSLFSYRLYLGRTDSINGRWNEMGALDGGLICFVSAWRPSEANPMCISVGNLLTQVWSRLPPLQYAYLTPPQMMHIKVDLKTKCYRVVVIGKSIKDHPTIEVYDSGARQWTKATPPRSCIFGLSYTWEYRNILKISEANSQLEVFMTLLKDN